MSVVKINVLQVPEGRGEVLEQRFAARAGEVDKVDGFESFELLRPTEGTDRYLVVTRWRDDAAFQAWVSSDAFTQGHTQARADAQADHGDTPSDETADPREPAPHGSGMSEPRPAAVGSQLWGFEIVTSASAPTSD